MQLPWRSFISTACTLGLQAGHHVHLAFTSPSFTSSPPPARWVCRLAAMFIKLLQLFGWVWGIQILVLTLVKQALYPVSHLPYPKDNLKREDFHQPPSKNLFEDKMHTLVIITLTLISTLHFSSLVIIQKLFPNTFYFMRRDEMRQ